MQHVTNLPYAPGIFDAVVISNALHIMPEPGKTLAEIRRVLKPGGILIAPTFTAAGSLSGRMRIRLMELSGFNENVQSVQFGRNGTDKGFGFCYPKKESGNPLFLNNYG